MEIFAWILKNRNTSEFFSAGDFRKGIHQKMEARRNMKNEILF
jgi:hypothetical protein